MALLIAATVTLVLGPPGPPTGVGLAAVAATVVIFIVAWYAGRTGEHAEARPVAAFRACCWSP